jgi:chemotaxis protein MotB
MAEGAPQTIIIKKIKKAGRHGSHGGAWKIAYADFVTAMMAFFLLLWLLNSVSQDSLEGISNYFAPVSVSSSTSGAGGVGGGQVISSEEGAATATSGTSITMELPPPSAGSGGEESTDAENVTENAAKQALEAIEQEQFDEAQEQIQQAIEADESLGQLKDSLKIDDTPEGLRIQLVDQDGLPMFQSGGSGMLGHTQKLMALVANVVKSMPQQLSISGHTDSVPFSNSRGYSNWELSSDRANSARRELMDQGVPYERVSRVIGKAATEPLLKDNPTHATNRRLSIILLRGTGEPLPPEEEVLPGLHNIKQKQLEDTLNPVQSGSPPSGNSSVGVELPPFGQ